METLTPPTADPAALLAALDVDALCQRVHDLEAERRATLVLLRAARARRRRAESRPTRKPRGPVNG
jgi:hypothetical protein